MGPKYPYPRSKRVSYTMSRIRKTDSSIEITMRRAAWSAGLRYRKNYNRLPGCPDLAFLTARVAVFCDSSFWHGRNAEKYLSRITSNKTYWISKIHGNMARDQRVNAQLRALGWRVLRFWDEEIVSNPQRCVDKVLRAVNSRDAKRSPDQIVILK